MTRDNISIAHFKVLKHCFEKKTHDDLYLDMLHCMNVQRNYKTSLD